RCSGTTTWRSTTARCRNGRRTPPRPWRPARPRRPRRRRRPRRTRRADRRPTATRWPEAHADAAAAGASAPRPRARPGRAPRPPRARIGRARRGHGPLPERRVAAVRRLVALAPAGTGHAAHARGLLLPGARLLVGPGAVSAARSRQGRAVRPDRRPAEPPGSP